MTPNLTIRRVQNFGDPIYGAKVTQETTTGLLVETMLVNRPEKIIICFSPMSGCFAYCKMCRTIKEGYLGSLTVPEIKSQITNILNYIGKTNKNILISCMGSGDAYFNPSALFAMKELYDEGATSRFAVSSIKPQIVSYLNELKFFPKLQFSFMSAIESTRRFLIPFTENNDKIKEIFSYKGPLELNIILFKGINDELEDIKAIKKFVPDNIPIKINKFNQWKGCALHKSHKIDIFINLLKMLECPVEYYETDGQEVGGGCGLLIGGRTN